MSNTTCIGMCSSLSTSPCVDVALMSQNVAEGVQTTTTKKVNLDCIPMSYVAFHQLFFKDGVFNINKNLISKNKYFKEYVENNKRFMLNTNKIYNLYENMIDLYECESETLQGSWDLKSKVNFTKNIVSKKTLADLTHVCPVECSLTLDELFCFLEADDETTFVIDPKTNMPQPPKPEDLSCPPQLINNFENNPDNTILLTKNKFIYVPDDSYNNCDDGPVCITIDIQECNCDQDNGNTYYVVNTTQDGSEWKDCSNSIVQNGTILISGIEIDGLYGVGGQYILTYDDTNNWTVKYWEQRANISITTRLSGKVPLLTSSEAETKRMEQINADTCNNTDYSAVKIANKNVSLDVVWNFMVDFTPASSGTGGFNYSDDGLSYGWSYPTRKEANDRKRKTLKMEQARKLMTNVKSMADLMTEYRSNLVHCVETSSPTNGGGEEDIESLVRFFTQKTYDGNTVFTNQTIDLSSQNEAPATGVFYKTENVSQDTITIRLKRLDGQSSPGYVDFKFVSFQIDPDLNSPPAGSDVPSNDIINLVETDVTEAEFSNVSGNEKTMEFEITGNTQGKPMYIGAYYPDNPQSNNNGINLVNLVHGYFENNNTSVDNTGDVLYTSDTTNPLPSSIKVAHVMPVHFMNIETNGITYG